MSRRRGSAIWQGGLALLLVLALTGPAAAAPTWLQLNPSPDPVYGSPIPRCRHTAVCNPATNRMIVFGGDNGSGYGISAVQNDVWVLTNADGTGGPPSWIKLTPGDGPPRRLHSAVYDQANNRMIVFGGHTLPGYNEGVVNDVWILTNADGTGGDPAWLPLSTTNPGPFKYFHKAAYDLVNNRMIVESGSNGPGPSVNESWVLTNANGLGGDPPVWTELYPAGTIPYGGYNLSSVGYDPAHNTLVETSWYYDYSQGSEINPVRLLSNANGLGGPPAWTDLIISGASPPLRSIVEGIYDAGRNRVVIFGGVLDVSPFGWLNETWRLDHANGQGGTPQWTQLNPAGILPSPRICHSAVYNPQSDRMIIFGGYDSNWVLLADVWVLTEAMGPPPVINVSIDIKPGSDVNSINPDSKGKIAVAILSTPDYDATTRVDRTSLKFGDTGDEVSLAFCTVADVNADGLLDLVAHFYTLATGFDTGDTQGYLKGWTVDGIPLSGSDAVRIVPGK